MNSFTKPKCSIPSTPMRKTRRARCNIEFIIRDGRIRKNDLNFLPIVKNENLPIVIQFTSLFSRAETPTSPFFVIRNCHTSLALLLSFPRTPSFKYIRCPNIPHLSIPPRRSRPTSVAVVLRSTSFSLKSVNHYRIVTVAGFRKSSAEDCISISTSY